MATGISARTVAAALGCAACLAASASVAADDRPVGRWWGGVEAGYGSLRESYASGDARLDRFTMNFRGGIIAAPRLLVGAELGGFLIESSDYNENPSRGRGISQVFGVAQYYFGSRREGLYFKGGAGYASFWGNHPTDSKRRGWGASAAVGWDVVTRESGAWGPVLTYTRGSMGNADYTAVTLGLAWTYQ